MHVAEQLWSDNLTIQVGGRFGELSDLFPGAHTHDRFGIVVDEPMGALGASLLIQAAIVQFYDVMPERRTSVPIYPEIYVFHVGRRHGDFSNFDFWPPRKEVVVPAGDCLALLEAVNDRAITRLALPDRAHGDPTRLCTGPSTWAEQAAARSNWATCLAYSPDGAAQPQDIVLATSDDSFESNVSSTLNPEAVLRWLDEASQDEINRALVGRSTPADIVSWRSVVHARLPEVPVAVRHAIAAQRGKPGERVETYRALSTNQALSALAGLGTL